MLWFIINHNTCLRQSLISDINILQGSLATCLMQDRTFTDDFFFKFTNESDLVK